MIDVTPAPSTLLKTMSTVARWSLGLLLAVWLVFLLAWGALHWLIVPRIGEFRPQLETKATQLLGVPVRIGAITAHSTGMIPSFELTDIQLFDREGREALHLPRILASLSPHALLHFGFEQLYIDRPELNIRRDRSGQIFVAGLDFSKTSGTDSGAADWFFSQLEFAIHDGTVQWTDELRAAPTLALKQVELVVRNRGRHHDLRLDATPPALWGDRFSLRGLFSQPLLSRSKSNWQEWTGQLYAELARVDLSELRRYADVGVDLHQGNGAVTAWVDVSQGQVVSAVADVALAELNVTLGADLQALALQSVRGRLGAKVLAAGFDFSTQGLQFDTRDGLHWPGGNVSVMYLGAEGQIAARGEFKADRLDLAALSQIANRLPMEAPVRAQLLAYAPKGLVDRVTASWQGPMSAMRQYTIKGQVSQLQWAALGEVPGLSGASVDFDLNQSGGRASINLANGSIDLPGFFEDPVITVMQLSTEAKWQIKDEHIAVQLPNLKFGNADAQGEAQIKWETSDPVKSSGRSRFPGMLDLQASLSRADGTRVYRYLPSVIVKPVRDYVRDALLTGSASAVRFKVKGDLNNMPFTDPKLGEFRVSADVQNATLAYVPRSLQPADALPWPALAHLNGELVIDRAQLQVKAARARMGAANSLQVSKLDAVIPDLNHATVMVNAEVKGPLAEALGVVNSSPIAAMTAKALVRAVATGPADIKLKLVLPIADMDKSVVQGSVTLNNNDLQINPETPRLTRARGVVNFSDTGFVLAGTQARMLGGDVRLEGGMLAPVGNVAANGTRVAAPIVIRASGTASAEGLRQAKEIGPLARLAQQASGSAAYTVVLGFRRGEPELLIASNLQGMALNLPAPLNKSAEALLPLRLETALVRDSWLPGPAGQIRLQDQLTLELGRTASVVYVRDISGPEPRVLRGSVAVGLAPPESAPMPLEGVAANINLSGFDLDAWGSVLTQTAGCGFTLAVVFADLAGMAGAAIGAAAGDFIDFTALLLFAAAAGAATIAAFATGSFATFAFVAIIIFLRVLDRVSVALKNGGKISQIMAVLSSFA